MYIDLPTLMLAGSFVAAISGAFLFFAWLQNRDATGPLWWAGANLSLAIGVPLLSSAGSQFGLPSVMLGILFLNLSPAMVWAAAVSCNQRRPNPLIVVAGAAIWLVAVLVIFRLGSEAQMALNLAVIAIYLLAAAAEFWLGNRGLQTRWPLIVLLVLHGTFFAAGAVLAATGGLGAGYPPAFDSWLGLIHFETLAFVIGTAIFAVAMVKEQREMEQMTAARVDPLTGVANRRAFLENAGLLLERAAGEGKPLSLVVFDLDRFKVINDTYGHAMGDRVLEAFGDIVQGVLRNSDVVGRMGGEEFAIALSESTARASVVVAERIRCAFAEACRGFGMADLRPTLSGGVAEAGVTGGNSLDSLFAAADRALYRAKAAGRDIVVIDDGIATPQPAPKPDDAPQPAVAAAQAA